MSNVAAPSGSQMRTQTILPASATSVTQFSSYNPSGSSYSSSSSATAVKPATIQLTSYTPSGGSNTYNTYTKGVSVTSDAIADQHWSPTSALLGLGNVRFASEETHFNGNLQNYGAQIYDLGQISTANMNASSIPDGWRTMGSAVQFNMLNSEELQFAQNVISQLTLNPPSAVPPMFNNNSLSLSPYSSIDQHQLPGDYPDSYQNNPIASQERRGSFSIEKAYIAKQEISKGVDLISKFLEGGASSESRMLLGESVLENASSGAASLFSTVGLEEVGAGLVAGGAELLGGAATVGAAVVGAEVLAGAAVVGLGIYEGYRAFGGTEDLSSITGKISSGASFISQWGDKIGHWIP